MSNKAQHSRFLMQATLGFNEQALDYINQQGIHTWLDEQLSHIPMELSPFEKSTKAIWQTFKTKLINSYGESAINGEGNNPALAYKWYFHMAWWQHTLGNNTKDALRQRVAQALSEILVISDKSSLELNAVGMASYYDLLYKHAFGNYVDLLYDVAMHPCMGVYLSHMNNRKADPEKNIHPDENFAREIMQLFTIGLYQLKMDGSYVHDFNGDPIPTYDNKDIKALARVFTGLKASSYEYEWNTSFWNKASFNGTAVNFVDGLSKQFKTVPYVNMTQAMLIDENYHDKGHKHLLDGIIDLPSNQSGEDDIRQTIESLVKHPNTAPFLAKLLIKQLVTSNPSPDYIRHVASAFGEKGNLASMIKAILSYPLNNSSAKESIDLTNKPQKLKSPLLRATQILKAFSVSNNSKKLWLIGDDIEAIIQQHPLSSPTVFNFYKPDFSPQGALNQKQLAAPEFELHNSATSIDYINMLYFWFFSNNYPAVSTIISQDSSVKNTMELDPEKLVNNENDRLKPDFQSFITLANNQQFDLLIEKMSILLTGKSRLNIHKKILNAFSNYQNNAEWVVQTVAFMICASAEFTILEA